MANKKLFLVTFEYSMDDYRSARVLATSKKEAIRQYCRDTGFEIASLTSYPKFFKVDNFQTGKSYYVYVSKLD